MEAVRNVSLQVLAPSGSGPQEPEIARKLSRLVYDAVVDSRRSQILNSTEHGENRGSGVQDKLGKKKKPKISTLYLG